MTDPLTWSISLGRWAGIQVRIHVILAAYLAVRLLDAALDTGMPVRQTAAWLGLLLLALALHELGHVAMAVWYGSEPEEIRLWPLGNFVGPAAPRASQAPETVPIAIAGLATSLVLALAAAITLNVMHAQMVFNPCGNAEGTGAPLLADGKTFATAFSPQWWVGWFGYLNWVLFVANLIPALPFDDGRVIRAWTEGPSRDNLVALLAARGIALVLLVAGLIRIFMAVHGGLPLILLAVLIFWLSRQETRMLEEGGYFDETVFGYDFSQGYTSLEAGPATVRPAREGALRRWRRRRSDLRRRRRAAQEAADESRMDEILAKLHREGRSALTDEEQRFLVRVSARYKNRPRSSG
jgi:Zn-dependent protease